MKMKKQKQYHIVEIFPKVITKTVESGKSIPLIKNIHDRLLVLFDTDTSIKESGVKKSLRIPKG